MKRTFSLFLTLVLTLSALTIGTRAAEPATPKAKKVYAGSVSTAVIDTDGNLWTWGSNANSVLGDGDPEKSNYDRGTPKKVLSNVAMVSISAMSGAAVKTDGSLWTWGGASNPALGDKTELQRIGKNSLPQKIMDNVVTVSMDDFRGVAVKKDGSLWGWGLNHGEIRKVPENLNENDTILAPIKIMDNVVDAITTSWATYALKTDGSLWTWGWEDCNGVPGFFNGGYYGPTKIMDNVVAFDATSHLCATTYSYSAIKKDGSLWKWGANTYGQVGNGGSGDVVIEPYGEYNNLLNYNNHFIIYQTYPVKVLDDVVAVSGSAAIKKDGSLWMWGDTSGCKLGTYPATWEGKQLDPVKIMDDVSQISIGACAIALKKDGTVLTWGSNEWKQLGLGEDNSVEYAGITKNPYFSPYSSAVIENTPSHGFTDVAPTSPFAVAINWAVDKGITAGTTATTFSPNNTCTTAQILTFLWRANGSPAPTGNNAAVPAGQYYTDAANWALEKGLTNNFSADTPATRAATVTYLWKLAGKPAAETAAFTDVDAGAEYAQAVAWAVKKGVTAGTSATTFAPDNTCTRGQIVTFLHRDLA